MKAYGMKQFGDIDHLNEIELETPQPTKGRIIVKTKAIALNPYDLTVIDGSAAEYRPINLPAIPTSDVSGIVVDKDESVTEFEVGDRIVGRANIGGLAEFVSVPHLKAAKISDNISFETAAALPNASISAYDIVLDILKDKNIDQSLVIGATGAVGATTVQLLKQAGSTVSGVLSSKNNEYAQQLGIDQIINYDHDQNDITKKYDVIINFAPVTPSTSSYVEHLKENGIFISTTGLGDINLKNAIDFNDAEFHNNRRALEYLVQQIDQQKLTVRIAEKFDFDLSSVQTAFRRLSEHHEPGKLVIVL